MSFLAVKGLMKQKQQKQKQKAIYSKHYGMLEPFFFVKDRKNTSWMMIQ